MKIKKDTEYAILGLVTLATENNCSVRYIAKKNNIPEQFLAKIFQKLSKANIIKPIYGAKGGYILAKSPSKITLHDIINIIQPNEINDTILSKNKKKNSPKVYLEKIISNINKKVIDEYKKITLKHFTFYFLTN